MPELIVNFLGISYKMSVTLCEDPTVPLIPLKTLILEDFVSTLSTFILSVPIPKTSFSRIFGYFKFPATEK